MSVKGTVLEKILDKKAEEVAGLKRRLPASDLFRWAQAASPARDFVDALERADHTAVIAEIKKASPSLGAIRPGVAVPDWAAGYQKAGAAAISVLTDGPFFGGSLMDLEAARAAVGVPVLRKDFIIDPLQLAEARAAGADAALLIAAALDPAQLKDLYQTAADLGLAALIEVHKAEELDAVLALNPPLVGVNNRDLTDLSVDLTTCLNLRPLIGDGALVVGESGIQGPEDVARLQAGGINAFLVGTALMAANDPEAALAALCRAGKAP